MGDVFVGQIGLTIRLETGETAAFLATATVKQIQWVLPRSGTNGAWTAQLSGTKLTYTTASSLDLPEEGNYVLQAYVEGSGFKLSGEKAILSVREPVVPITEVGEDVTFGSEPVVF